MARLLPPAFPGDSQSRDRAANEGTLLAWIRNGIAVMAFGLAVARFGLFVGEVATGYHSWSISTL
jgi:putative membrane protein